MVARMIIILFINAVIGAIIYDMLIDKGYSTSFCVFMGFLGLLIGALLITFAWVLPDVNSKSEENNYNITDWICPQCGKNNSALLHRCDCGYIKKEQEE